MKSASQSVLLGYEVGSGTPVSIPVDGHLCVTGMTQKAGKTTALDAIITRSGRQAITFITKRGEKSFADAPRIKPYFRERADWQFVEALMSAVMGQKMRFERGWIIRASRGARTLADVNRNIEKAMETAKGLNADIYLQLHEYLKIVLPQIDRLDYAGSVRIGPGLNVMDLSAYSSELQALVIRSVLEWVHEKETGVIVVIPEAWETLPEGRGSPVKLACEQIFRKGAGIGNLIWLDSQDIAGVWKEALRACSVWIMGVQGEIHEVKRMLAHLPTPNSLKPKPEQVMCLSQGQFYVRYGRELKLVYVRPVWMAESPAIRIARGEASNPNTFKPPAMIAYETRPVSEEKRFTAQDLPMQVLEEPRPVKKADYSHSRFTEEAVDERKERDYQNTIKRLEVQIEDLQRQLRGQKSATEPKIDRVDGEQFNRAVLAAANAENEEAKEALTLALGVGVREIEVTIKRRTIVMSDDNADGRLARLISEDFFDEPRKVEHINKEFRERGWFAQTGRPQPLGPTMARLAEWGFVRVVGAGTYQSVPDMKIRVKEEEVAA